MKIAIVYNRESKRVINLFGVPNREKYGLKSITRISNALKEGGHHVIALEGDKDLLERLEEYMPSVLKGERPGMVFNLSYGIQGQARYTHVPGMLEMGGIPYVGSGPLAHSLALDKVVAKMIFKQEGIPTPDFAVLKDPDFEAPQLEYPLIVKPKNEAVSFGIRIAGNEGELREAADIIFEKFQQPVLAERYIDGREINVGLLGNNPPEAFPPAELLFGEGGPPIYTLEDKMQSSGREVIVQCPANISEALARKAQEIALHAFSVLGCYDCARVDMRIDGDENIFVLEINSLPSLGAHGSYTHAAEVVGLDFNALVNRLVDVASSRYFGTPKPPELSSKVKDPADKIFAFLTARRDRIEKRVKEWTRISSRTSDPVGIRTAVKEADRRFREFGLLPRKESTNHSTWTWETPRGIDRGTLFIGHLDIPLDPDISVESFRRDPEHLYGEGVGSSRGPLVMLEYALGALRHARKLKNLPLGVLLYGDEGYSCRYSAELIHEAASRARRVLVLHPGNPGDKFVTQRRGRREYRLMVDGQPRRPGQVVKKPELFLRLCKTIQEIAALPSKQKRISISPVEFESKRYPMVLPHHLSVVLMMTYLEETDADDLKEEMEGLLKKSGFNWELDLLSDRPPLIERRNSLGLLDSLTKIAQKWEIPLAKESSVWPSAAGLVPPSVAALCGVGPVALNLYTPREAIQRVSLVQRTLLLAEFLAEDGK